MIEPNYFKPLKIKQLQKNGLGKGVSVLVIGTGCNTKLDELKDVIELPSIFSDDLKGDNARFGHETQVASIIYFIAPKTRIYSLDVDSETLSDPIKGFKFALDNYDKYRWDLINCSMNTGGTDELKGYLKALKEKGVITLSTTGNEGSNEPGYPAKWTSEDLCISVGSCDFNWNKSKFSNAGEDVLFPGEALTTLWKDYDKKKHPATYKWMYTSGTSFACPIATGILALAISRFGLSGVAFSMSGARTYLREYVKSLQEKSS